MCLYVDYNKEIDDNRIYTFYKIYKIDAAGRRISPFRKYEQTGNKLVAKFGGKNLPLSGQKAYDKFAEEFEYKSGLEGVVTKGIHAYATKKAAENSIWWYGAAEIVTVKVRGEHIIAFGLTNGGYYREVAFTRGTISQTIFKRRGH